MSDETHSQEAPAPEAENDAIDLNHLFPGEDTDLNELFPDEDIKRLLKNISKNKKDLSAIKERISEENLSADEPEASL